jgi:peptidoglycan/LPS O-acetylase OafA/YrhL
MAMARLTVPLPGETPLRERIRVPWPVFSGVCWAAALLIFIWRMDSSTGNATRQILNGFIALFLLIPVFTATAKDRGVESWLAWRPMRWLGLVSYGSYLAHRPLLRELHAHGLGTDGTFGGFLTLFLVGGGLAVVLGALSYYVLERPILRNKAGRGRSPQPLAQPAVSRRAD